MKKTLMIAAIVLGSAAAQAAEFTLLRADAAAMRAYLPALESAAMMCEPYAVYEGGPATALYLVEASVRKVNDY